ncbi:hypothetical protein V6N11_003295 [Hibiscus sabdariffa]|uniref:DUF632 domain-containing protein n=1 Tax=Hibiscus sabdariffa TaxID=183260 RepID=A0ABR2SDH3_9ROSI
MWKVILECHSCQYQKLTEAKCLDAITLNENLNDTHLEVTMKLKLELQNWNLSFSSWIEAQRGYVKALNVVGSHGFWNSINQVLEHQNSTPRIIADKDTERKLKDLEKEEKKMQARVKNMTLWERKESTVVPTRDTSTTDGSDTRDASASLQYGLKQIFKAMEKLASQSKQAYEELPQCIEKCKATQDKA